MSGGGGDIGDECTGLGGSVSQGSTRKVRFSILDSHTEKLRGVYCGGTWMLPRAI